MVEASTKLTSTNVDPSAVTDPLENPVTASLEMTSTTTPPAPQAAPQVVTVTETDSDDEDQADTRHSDTATDSASKAAESVVCISLVFFACVVVLAVVLVVMMMKQFRLLGLVMVVCIVLVFVGIGYFLDRVMKENAQWKPIRRKIHRLQVMATTAVLQEMRDFQLDLYQHLLLTDGREYDTVDPVVSGQSQAGGLQSQDGVAAMPQGQGQNRPNKRTKRRRAGGSNGGRSILFKAVKPFLNLRPGRRRRKKEEQRAAAAAAANQTNYVPPVV